jgi:hypothetical protein
VFTAILIAILCIAGFSFGILAIVHALRGSKPSTGTHDTGTHDTGTHGTGTHDTGTHDTGTHDTGTHDTGTHDTGTHDTGTHDTGTHGTGTHDTGTHDTGTSPLDPPPRMLFPDHDLNPNLVEAWPSTDTNVIISHLKRWSDEQGGSQATWGARKGVGHLVIFHPGRYDFEGMDLRVPFMTSLLGLGLSPEDVVLTNCTVTVPCDGSTIDCPGGGSTQIFWRDVQNLTIDGDLDWYTSQACPVRRLICTNNLKLDPYNAASYSMWSSGGFLGNVRVDGTLSSETQQQFCFKNITTNKYSRAGGMNMVFVNSDLPSPTTEFCTKSGESQIMEFDKVTHGKPFVLENGTVCVPGSNKKKGAQFLSDIIIKDVVFIDPSMDFGMIQDKVNTTQAIVFTSGFYRWNRTLIVSNPKTILLCIGWPVFNAGTHKNAMFKVEGADVHLAGIMVDAGPGDPDSLVEITGPRAVIHDLFCRTTLEIDKRVACKNMLRVSGNDAYMENVWLWRGDHGPGIEWGQDKSWNNMDNPHAVTVTGNNVVAIGLFAEHQSDAMVVWEGEAGEVYFYQSEFPYAGYSTQAPSYVVSENVQKHYVSGAGIYFVVPCDLVFDFAMQVPSHEGIKLKSIVGRNWYGLRGVKHTLKIGNTILPDAAMTAGQTFSICSTHHTQINTSGCKDPGEDFWGAWDPQNGCLIKDWPVYFPNICPNPPIFLENINRTPCTIKQSQAKRCQWYCPDKNHCSTTHYTKGNIDKC